MFENIKKSLSNVPEEVIRSWLLPIAEGEKGYGWPPPEEDLGKWRYALARKSLDYWGKTLWKHRLLGFQDISLCPYSLMSVTGLIRAHALDEQNEYSRIANGRERFVSIVHYIYANGTFPDSIILSQEDDKLEIIDGNHRLAALIYVYRLWQSEETKAQLSEQGCVKLLGQHNAWIITPPAEGEYTPDPLTERQEQMRR